MFGLSAISSPAFGGCRYVLQNSTGACMLIRDHKEILVFLEELFPVELFMVVGESVYRVP